MGNTIAVMPRHRIEEFEGLRGCLAWWVVLFHLGLAARIDAAALTNVEKLFVLGGWQAVELFIILSGFVIALLLEVERERYTVYIVRRFFRLAPVYYLVLAYGIAVAVRQGLYTDRLGEHILLHLSILHGLVPDEILKGSANAFCHPAWSISVEWQFYLIAPLVLALIRGSATWALGILVACAALSAILTRLGTFPFHATLVMRAGLFGVGIASYYFYRYVLSRRELSPQFVAFLLPAGMAFVWVFHIDPTPVNALWIVLLWTVLAYRVGVETYLTRPLRHFLVLPFVVWIGRLSYCTYLCHMLVLSPIVDHMNGRLGSLGTRGRLLALILVVAPPILAVSAALHYLVEKPGMQVGKRVTSWMATRKSVPRMRPRQSQPT